MRTAITCCLISVLSSSGLGFGYGGEESIDGDGDLEQPFYQGNNNWYQLTYNTYPMSFQISGLVFGTPTVNYLSCTSAVVIQESSSQHNFTRTYTLTDHYLYMGTTVCGLALLVKALGGHNS